MTFVTGLLVAALAAGSVQVGLDRIDADHGGPLRGKRVGLVANAASVTADGRRALDVLRAREIEVVRVFAPEHGPRSESAAGEAVADGVDAETGVPVVSLYGGKLKPSAEDLEGIDSLVVDLQDVGVRFYTYAGTLLLCLDAAAEAGVELVVLDRPNPLGGDRVEGPLRSPRDVPDTPLNLAPGPLVHGLTLGELARYANDRRDEPARLRVVQMKGWERGMVWTDTGLRWVPPSPNLRSPEAALAYPGVALLEATSVSEGRGTPDPFRILGAPWLSVSALMTRVAVPGFALTPVVFTPAASAAAPSPKYAGVECRGVRVDVVSPHRASPYTLGIALLHALRWQQPRFEWNDDGLAALLGTRKVYRALRQGRSVEEIVALDAAAHAAWRQDRRKALLY